MCDSRIVLMRRSIQLSAKSDESGFSQKSISQIEPSNQDIVLVGTKPSIITAPTQEVVLHRTSENSCLYMQFQQM